MSSCQAAPDSLCIAALNKWFGRQGIDASNDDGEIACFPHLWCVYVNVLPNIHFIVYDAK